MLLHLDLPDVPTLIPTMLLHFVASTTRNPGLHRPLRTKIKASLGVSAIGAGDTVGLVAREVEILNRKSNWNARNKKPLGVSKSMKLLSVFLVNLDPFRLPCFLGSKYNKSNLADRSSAHLMSLVVFAAPAKYSRKSISCRR